ncbi:MAG: HAD-IA family hydrolase [Anaerolineae bacterium]|nr:HAD-IA family hydrolase [Anaerolineae bacterium]NIN95638.1 HAD-IA family hydrolase [Anaerolineae bacterium]NIQ78595.1 HAD-IA family hydrolase [Anaerolineae bacterium]
MNGLRGIIFDLGNTLMYMGHEWSAVLAQGGRDLAEFLVNKGIEIEPGQFADDFISLRRTLYKKSVEQQVEYTADYTLTTLLAQLGYERVSDGLIEQATNAFFAFEESYWQPYPESQDTLRELSERGYRLALISNATYDPLIQRLVDKGDFRKWLDMALSSAAVGLRKPHPGIFQMVLDHWGFPPSQVLMIGDVLRFDIAGAHNSGMKGILAAWDLYPDYDAEADFVVPDARVDSLTDLVEVIVVLDEQLSEGDA